MTEEQKLNLKRVLKTYTLTPKQEDVEKPQTFELPSKTKFVTGFLLSANNKSKLNFRGKIRLSIGGDELIEADTPASLFLSSVGVPVEKRYFDLGDVEPGDFSVKPEFKDEDNAAAAWDGGYSVYLTFETWQTK